MLERQCFINVLGSFGYILVVVTAWRAGTRSGNYAHDEAFLGQEALVVGSRPVIISCIDHLENLMTHTHIATAIQKERCVHSCVCF